MNTSILPITPTSTVQAAIDAYKIPTLLDTEDKEFEHCVIHGDSETGKTLQLCMLSEFYNVLVFDGDKGLKTAIRTLPQEMQKRIRPIRIPDNTSNPIYWNTILKVITGLPTEICIEHGIHDCKMCFMNQKPVAKIHLNKLPSNWVVGMDSVTQFVASAINSINKTANPKAADTVDTFKFQFDEWGVLRQITEKFGNYVKDLQCNFVAISHSTLVKTEDLSTMKLVPIGGTDNASRNFAKNFSSCVYAKIMNNRHVYVSSSTAGSNVQTGTRSHVKLETMETPALLHIFRKDAAQLLKGSWTEWFFKGGVGVAPQVKPLLPEEAK